MKNIILHENGMIKNKLEIVSNYDIRNKKIGIIGYGRQGRAHALNLKDYGCNVSIGLRNKSKSISIAKDDGINVKEISKLVKESDI